MSNNCWLSVLNIRISTVMTAVVQDSFFFFFCMKEGIFLKSSFIFVYICIVFSFTIFFHFFFCKFEDRKKKYCFSVHCLFVCLFVNFNHKPWKVPSFCLICWIFVDLKKFFHKFSRFWVPMTIVRLSIASWLNQRLPVPNNGLQFALIHCSLSIELQNPRQ